jgi:uroporphyrinogen decarboxylase
MDLAKRQPSESGQSPLASDAKPLIRALRGEAQARPPFWLMRQAGRYLPEYQAVRARTRTFLEFCYSPELAAEVTLQPVQRFGMDAAIIFSDILVIPDALGQAVTFEAGRGPVLRPIQSIADLGTFDEAELRDYLAPIYEALRLVRAELPRETALIGFAGAPWTVAAYMVEGGSSVTYERLKAMAYGRPDEFAQLIDRLVAAISAHLIAQIEAGAEALQIFDSWAGILPDAHFHRWSIAPTAAIVRQVKARYPDVPIIGFPNRCGVLYAAYAAETGVDAVSLDTTVPLDWARESLQSRLAVQGNLDPQMLVVGGEAMKQEIKRILDAFGAGAFVFNLGHGIVPSTPPDHVAELAALIRDWTQAG